MKTKIYFCVRCENNANIILEQWKTHQHNDDVIGPVLRHFKHGRRPDIGPEDHPDCALLMREWDRLSLRDGILYRKSQVDAQTE